jgi:hypothetical protein
MRHEKTYRLAAEFDAIFERIKRPGLHMAALLGASKTASSMTGIAAEALISRDPNGHVLELMTMPQ